MHRIAAPRQSALRRGRHSRPGGIYFVTTVTDRRTPWFANFRRAQLMCQNLCSPTALGGAENLCFVVMPDHIHVLLQLADCPLERVVNRLKSRSAVILNRSIGRDGRFWCPGFYDHAVRKEEYLVDVARYIVANPLRAGLVRRISDYPFWNAKWL
jgi:REP element-mobilizing transposase RayT